MGKKNRNNNVNTESAATEVFEATETSAASEEVVDTPVEEVKEEVPVEEVAEESVKEEATVVEVMKDYTSIQDDEIATAEDSSTNKIYPAVTSTGPAPAADEAVVVTEDEEPLGPVDYFVQINKEPFTDEKLAMVEERLDKYQLSRFVSAEGIVLVGPYATKDGAINGRRLVIRCGLKGDIVEIPKDNV